MDDPVVADGANNEKGAQKGVSFDEDIASVTPEIEMEDTNQKEDTTDQKETQQGETSGNNDEKINQEERVEEVAGEDKIEEDEGLSLPLSKIKKIIKADQDYATASQSAVYAAGFATELFVQYLTEQAIFQARTDKRRRIQYQDMSNAVAAQDSLAFLRDTVPKTQPLSELVKNHKVDADEHTGAKDTAVTEEDKHKGDTGTKSESRLPKGQQTLNFRPASASNDSSKLMVIGDLVSADDATGTD